MAESQDVATLEGENAALLVMLRAAETQRDEARANAGKLFEELADKTAELVRVELALGEARKESSSFWNKVRRQAENLTNLNDRVNQQGADNAVLATKLSEARAENARLREVLRFYANEDKWHPNSRARQALAKETT